MTSNIEQFSYNNSDQKNIPESNVNDKFTDLKFVAELKDFENINQVVEMYKKEIEGLFGYQLRDDNANKPTGAVEYLACYLAERMNANIKNIKEFAKSSVQCSGDQTEYWDFGERIPDNEVEAFKKKLIAEGDGDTGIDYESIHGDVNWMKEHILEYTYYENDLPGSMVYYIHKWDDTGLKNAIEKWIQYIKSL